MGSLVEFRTPASIRSEYPAGVRDLADGGVWNTIAGQPTDDSEMALTLARLLANLKAYDAGAARKGYVGWLDSDPFDIGNTTLSALRGRRNHDSQANGALMRISPLRIFGACHSLEEVAAWAEQDAEITDPHRVFRHSNSLFAAGIAHAVRTGCSPAELHCALLSWSGEWNVDDSVRCAVELAAQAPPPDYMHQQGWVLIALRNAVWQLVHAPNLEEGVVGTIMRGGDTDTNAAICGALLAAVHGRDAVPVRWTRQLLSCRPGAGRSRVRRPRPRQYWAVDALELAARLVRSQQEP